MPYELLPGGGTSSRGSRSPPARAVAGHLMNKLRRPSRIRSRILLFLFTAIVIVCLMVGRQHAYNLRQTASAMGAYSSYIPTTLADVIAQYGELDNMRWDDDLEDKSPSKSIIKKPKFHLLIPANIPTANLCKTLLSAAILNYPPPTLVSYGATEGNNRAGADVVRRTFSFLLGKEVHDDDLMLVLEDDAWLQLPAEVTVNRFFHGMRDLNAKLLDKYGRITNENWTIPVSRWSRKYTQRVLFGAAKECSNAPSDPACYSPPQSPLPKDIYGSGTDKHSEGKYNRPRFMQSTMVMGRVADLRPIYKQASEMLEFEKIGEHGSQYIFSKIFGEQEYQRDLEYTSSLSMAAKFLSWFATTFSNSPKPSVQRPNITLHAGKTYEYGIGLDYASSIFQVMNNSAEDIRFVKFDHPSVIASPSKLSASSFKNPIHLPPDLSLTPPPFSQHEVSTPNPDPPITVLDNIEDQDTPWSDIELATNVIVPGSSVPASLNFHGSEGLLSKMWENMWFYKHARALMRQYIRSPDGPIAAEAAAAGGDRWWDLRGGKGGVWTDRGEWLEWNEVCGAFDEEVFGDGKGEFGREKEDVGGQKVVYNRFGQVVSGRLGTKQVEVTSPAPENQVAKVVEMLEDGNKEVVVPENQG